MRKMIAIVLAVLAIGGSAMAINNSGVFSGNRAANTTRNTQTQAQADSLIDIATEAPVVTAEPTATPVVTATPAPVAEVTAEPSAQAMSFMYWLQKAQSTPTGALNGTFDEERATRVIFVEEEISGYATFEVAGSYFSTKVDGYEFTAGHKSAGEATFISCEEHPGMFFDWTTRYNGDLVRYELTSELVSELKEVAVCWQDEAGNTVYGILLCQHNSSSPATSSNAGNGGNGGNGGEQPIVTPPPSQAPTNEPPATTPAPLPEAPEEEDVPAEDDPIVTQPPVENDPEYSDTEETTVPENEDPIVVGTPVDNTPTYNDESATSTSNGGKQDSASQQAAPLMAAPLQEVEEAPAQEQTVQVEDDPIVVTEPVQETSVQDMAPLMVPPAE